MKQTLKYIKRKNIDVEKYDACITNAQNSRVYAYSWYLDIVADDWVALVMGDYEVVMPIPYMRVIRKFFRKKIVQPIYCQQLGVFYKKEISQTLFDQFYKKFQSLNPFVYSFNSENARYISSLEKRPNFELNINKSYEDIYSGYSNNLKRNIKKAKKNKLEITENIGVNEYISLKKANKRHKVSKKNFKRMKQLVQQIEKLGFGRFEGVTFENEIVAIAFFVKSKKRLIHLFSVTTLKGKKIGSIALLFDYNINKYVNKDYFIDFEGSVIPGVASFFQSFGATKKNYYLFNK